MKLGKLGYFVHTFQVVQDSYGHGLLHVVKFELRDFVLFVRTFHATGEAARLAAFLEVFMVVGEDELECATEHENLLLHITELIRRGWTKQKEGLVDHARKHFFCETHSKHITPFVVALQALRDEILNIIGHGFGVSKEINESNMPKKRS